MRIIYELGFSLCKEFDRTLHTQYETSVSRLTERMHASYLHM